MIGFPEIAGILSLIAGIVGPSIYLHSVIKGQTRPHFYSWLIWSILTVIGFLAQIHDKAGAGAWALALTTLSCVFTMILSLRYGETNITRSDKIALIAALAAMIPWLLMKDPLGSVILISIIDVVAFFPTFRKSWLKPHEEKLTGYNLANLKFLFALAALETWTLNTALYLAVCISINAIFVAVCLWRRHALA